MASLCRKRSPTVLATQPVTTGTSLSWQKFYKNEKKNFDGYGDPGEVWFGPESSERVIKWLLKAELSKDKSIVDIGCGNGDMLLELRGEGYRDLTGIDYSENAIELAKSVAESHQCSDIKFKVCDITAEVPSTESRTYDIVLDKGTYDAISLNPDSAGEQRQRYIRSVAELVAQDGVYIITSCNWTDSELVQHFKEIFDFYEKIPTPTFSFGGSVGNVVSCLVLKKKTIT